MTRLLDDHVRDLQHTLGIVLATHMRGYRPSELSVMTGISIGKIEDLLFGRAVASYSEIALLAQALGIRILFSCDTSYQFTGNCVKNAVVNENQPGISLQEPT